MDSALDWNEGDLDSVPSSASGLLGDLGNLTSALCALVSPSVKWDNYIDLLCKVL